MQSFLNSRKRPRLTPLMRIPDLESTLSSLSRSMPMFSPSLGTSMRSLMSSRLNTDHYLAQISGPCTPRTLVPLLSSTTCSESSTSTVPSLTRLASRKYVRAGLRSLSTKVLIAFTSMVLTSRWPTLLLSSLQSRYLRLR